MKIIMLLLFILVPGAINLGFSYSEFLKKCCRQYPSFEPTESYGFWYWTLLELIVPGLSMFIFLSAFYSHLLNFDSKLFGLALFWGFLFRSLSGVKLPGGPELLQFSLEERMTQVAIQQINTEMWSKNKDFWKELEQELEESAYLDEGLKTLASSGLGINTSDEKREADYHEKCLRMIGETNLTRKALGIIDLIKKCPESNLTKILPEFGVGDSFLKKHFSRKLLRYRRSRFPS